MTVGIRPLLKWAGGKRRSAARIVDLLLAAGARPHVGYAEPFAGGLAVFCELRNRNGLGFNVTIGDINPRLIGFYRGVSEDPIAVVRSANDLPIGPDADDYDAIRQRFNALPDDADPVEIAALLAWLNHHGFNGLYRENSQGKYNTPWNRGTSRWNPALAEYVEWSDALLRVRLFDRPYWDGLPVDTIYCDPPYCGGFTDYCGPGWTYVQQAQLGDWARRMAGHGSIVAVSDRDSPAARAAYQGAQIEILTVRHGIGGRGKDRRNVDEILAIFGGNYGR